MKTIKNTLKRIFSIVMLLSFSYTLIALETPFAGDPAISPDGKTVCFVYCDDLWLVPFEGGIPRRITNTTCK